MRDRQTRWLRGAAASFVLVAAAAGAVVAAAPAAGTAAAKLTVRSSEYGKTLFGPSGKVVYVFGADHGSTSRCYGVCSAAWPPLLTTAAPVAGPGVEAQLLGTTKRKDGKLQVTYKGHPLYTFLADKTAGQTSGEGSKNFGAAWYALAPSGATIDRD